MECSEGVIEGLVCVSHMVYPTVTASVSSLVASHCDVLHTCISYHAVLHHCCFAVKGATARPPCTRSV